MKSLTRKDEIFTALTVMFLLFGTATGKASVLFIMSVILLVLMLSFNRSAIRGGALFVALTAVITAIIIGVLLIAIK